MRSLVRWTLIALLITLALDRSQSELAAQETTPPAQPAALGDTLRLDLATAVSMAAERSAIVEFERYALIEAQSKVNEDRAALLPHVGVDAIHGRRTFNTASFGIDFPAPPGQPPLFDPNGQLIGPVTNVDLRGHFAQTLFDMGAIARLRSARASVDASRVRQDAAKEHAGANAASAYVQALRAEGRLRAREEDLALGQELLTGAQALLSSGVGVRIDVTRAEAQLATIKADLVGARSVAERNRLALLRALSLPLDTPIRLGDALDGAPENEQIDVDAAVSQAIAQRSDVREVEARLDAARLDVDAVRAERLPSLALVANEGVNARQYEHLLNTYDWAVRVSVPVFEGGRIKAREQEERAQASEIETRLKEMKDQITFEVRDAVLQLGAARDLMAASQARLTLAQAELDQARDRFRAGVAGSIDVVTASIRLSEARVADADARAAYQSARVTLATAEGSVENLR